MAHASLKEHRLPSIATLRAVAALQSQHLAPVRPARIGLGFESVAQRQKSLAHLEDESGGTGRLALPYSLRLLLDAMTGLSVLHRAFGFVHGEVQPDHVLLSEDGVGRLLPVVRAHWVRGEERRADRLHYLAPEKLLGDAVDVRADVFSFGVLLWEAISGERLLQADAEDDILARWMAGGIPRAQPPEEEDWASPLPRIVERALSLDPARRFPSIEQLKGALEQTCSRHLPTTASMAELFEDPARRARGAARDSTAPDSQRITLPPHQAPATSKPRAMSEPPPPPSIPRLPPVGVAPYDLEEELTTKPNAAPLPPDALPAPPLPMPPKASESRPVAPPSFRPAPVTPRGVGRPAPSSRPAASLSPVVTARAVPSPALIPEPTFDLLRPRRRKGAWWVLAGAAAAIALFAARSWLSEQLTASAASPVPEAAPPVEVGPAPLGSGLASSPADPSGKAAPARKPGTPPASPAARPNRPRGAREEHVVIQDTIDPSIQALREVPSQAAPVAPPTTSASAPSAPARAPDSSAVDRYGI